MVYRPLKKGMITLRFLDILTKKNSGTIAKKRLQFLLVADRAGCSPEILEMIRDDMIKTISKYMEIDTNGLEIKIVQVDMKDNGRRLPVLYASIPVRMMMTKGIYL